MPPGKKKNEIGKGIRALLANIDTEEVTKKKGKRVIDEEALSIGTIRIDQIETNPYQPRKDFDEDEMSELATSIETFGIIQPITVRRLSSKVYQVISGERRWKASKMVGLKEIPAYVREADDQAMLEMSLLENIQRTDLNALEVALSYQRLIEECDLTHEELSQRLGKKRSSITNYLRVLKLPAPIQKALKSNMISLGHAKVLAGIDKTEMQLLLLEKILTRELSVRATEKELSKLNESPDLHTIKSMAGQLPEIKKIMDQLSEKVGSKVNITRSASGKGQIKIHFANDEEFNDVIDVLLDA